MKQSSTFLPAVCLGALFLLVINPAFSQLPVGVNAVPVGQDAVPVGENAVPIGQGAVPIGQKSVPVGANSGPVGQDAVPVGAKSVPVGAKSVPVGATSVPVGQDAVPVGANSVPVGQDAVPVGATSVPVGQDAVPVGAKSGPVGQEAVPVGAKSGPVGQDASLTSTVAVAEFLRTAALTAAKEHPKTKALFSGSDVDRWKEAKQRMIQAISLPNELSAQVIEQRRAQDRAWGNSTRRLAGKPGTNVFRAPFWQGYGDEIKFPVPYTQGSTYEDWFRKPEWAQLVEHLSLPESARPFEYLYDRNIIFHGDVIYVNRQPIASYKDFILSARYVSDSADKPDSSGWLPLGSFVVSNSNTTSLNPQAIQLAVNREGIIAGIYAHWHSKSVHSVQGIVNPLTQRVVFTIGDKYYITMETGLANFLENEIRLWVHLPDEHSETWLLARLP